ncbi:hypothetical protein SAMN03159476_00360 [Pseudomonas sp. NFPP05]|uniref:hypothetical protein n=1 Tax=unclassified Pseudomonas TaxID=196821 RepID=UPI00088D2CF0|nr:MULTISPECIES: hypothetical protein [unclassified Pseudomonas]SDA11028.1 hypothetical protein SAMN03159465_00360 [Pseudomonas sp. NFPP12]SFM11786.1 hypothetical protein SAMN03159476_00360 [Pseudomonas sp. NFPP05]
MPNKNVELGHEMWSLLSTEFIQCAVDNGASEQKDLAQVWAGFFAAASGAMCAQIGAAYSQAILDAVQKTCMDAVISQMQEVRP